MSYGLEVKNNNGEILIDGINRLPLLHEKITIDTSTTGSKVVEFTPTNDIPFILMYFENCTLTTGSLYKNNSGEFYGISCEVIQAGGQAEFYIYTV
jgi:hypothetical protein